MLSETAAEIQFPATCARCGVRVAERVSFCPHCGTHARLAFAKSLRETQSSRAPAQGAPAQERKEPTAAREGGVPPWSARPQPLFAAAGEAEPFAGIAAPIRDFGAEGGRRWGVKASTAITLAAFVALFGSIVLLHRHDDAAPSPQDEQAPVRTVEGSVQPGASVGGKPSGHANDAPAVAPTPPAVAAARVPPKPVPAAPPPAASPAPEQSVAAVNVRPDPARTSVAPATPAKDNAQSASSKVDAAPERGQSKEAPAVARRQERNRYASTAPKEAARRSVNAYTDAAIPPQPAVPMLPGTASPSDTPRASIGNSSYSLNDAPAVRSANAQREPHQASVERSIALAQASLAKANLAAARRALDAARAAQPGNSEAFMLQQDLVSRERARDSALNSARVCAVQQEWNCAWHQAGSALSIDAGSVEAKALVQRAMIESGAAFRPPGPGADGPDVPLLAQ
ncbi:hypothetical protein GWC77_08370 [Paraburkholderia sp. NMBU_R16]|uniref:zinc ribbon domain-containing protein n=1 Tax=Paraburkholderia sp. NMBU_R16 TaxID=2698676 RepID=UPI0015658E36|nr:zinc ribbon domain-containing protein [Paraburkholderia sp. NMBU_R16]NRO95949.1 hypothetical protein [Paraburkholderia sp. NMBU_R16]